MDFSNKNLWVLFEWGDTTVYATQTHLSTWCVMAVLMTLAIIVRLMLPRFKSVPKGFQNVIEALVEVYSNFAASTLGTSVAGYDGLYFGIIAFILLANYSGLVGLRPPTADLATTGALAIYTFVLIHYTGIRQMKWRYLKSYIEPNPIFLPINIMGEISKPISMCFRLFGNMLGGVIIIGMIYQMLPLLLRFVLPDILHAYFDIFAGALQAFIFTVLSMTFITQKAVTD